MKTLVLGLFSVWLVAGSEMDSPGLGIVWDEGSKSLRRIAGLPGSLRNEAGPLLPEDTIRAWVSPQGGSAVVATSAGKIGMRNLKDGVTDWVEGEVPTQVVFSPDGLRVGLWWKESQRFGMWGEMVGSVAAKAIVLPNVGEPVVLEEDGLLRGLSGTWIGKYDGSSVVAMDAGRLVVASKGSIVLNEWREGRWQEEFRLERDTIPAVQEVLLEKGKSLLAVGMKGELERWDFANGVVERLAESGVGGLRVLAQPGFYVAAGETPQIVFAAGTSQKLYLMPGAEVQQ
jgi:hypothetical protein